MAEHEVIECPPTPEHLPVADSPNPIVRELLDTSSSDVGDTTDGRSSPPPKCAICLGKCRNKCFTDSCLHQFCYKCLLEWSKIKAECPLCKQIFRSIIHNVRSLDQFEEHQVRPTPLSTSQFPHSQLPNGQNANNSQSVYHRLDFLLSEPPRFTYRAQQSDAIHQLFMDRSPLIERFSREYAEDIIPYRQHGSVWRRYIYDRRLYALPLADITGRIRECSAAFFRENPAQVHRIMPWVNRELVALFRGNQYQVELMINYFPELLTQHDITSQEFRQHMFYWGQQRTDHFVHELLNYARSPFDMIGYDRNVRYTPYFTFYPESEVVISSGSETSDADAEDVIRVSNPRRGRTQFTIETRSSHSTVIVTGSFGGLEGTDGVTATTNSIPNSNASAIPSSRQRLPSLTALNIECQRNNINNNSTSTSISANNNSTTINNNNNISLTSSSDDDDIQFVGAQKPPHLRTPELVTLNSDTDSDVVFVTENASEKKVPVVTPGVFMQSVVYSEEDEDTSTTNSNNLSGCKQEDNKDFNIPSTSSAFSPMPTSSKSSSSTITSASLRSNAPDYDNCASTSVATSLETLRKKMYAYPKLNHHNVKKSVFMSSDTDTSSTESQSSSHDEVKFNIKTTCNVYRNRKRKYNQRRCENSDSDKTERKKVAKKSKTSSKTKEKVSRKHKVTKKPSKTTSKTSRASKKIKKEDAEVASSSRSSSNVVNNKRKLKSAVIKKYETSSDETSDEDNTSESEFYVSKEQDSDGDFIDEDDSDSNSDVESACQNEIFL